MKMRDAWIGAVAVLLLAGSSSAGDRTMPITTSSDEARKLYVEARSLMDSSQRDRARPLLERATELDPDFVLAQLLLARTQLRGADVRAVMERAAEMQGAVEMSEAEALYLEAMLAGRRGDTETQRGSIERLGEMYPHDERVLTMVGGLHYGRDDELAIDYFRRAVEAAPDWASGYNTLGYAYKNVGRTEEAAVVFEKAIEIEPDNPNGYDSYGELLLRMGRFEDAIASYDRVLEIEPLFPSAQMGIASGLMHLGRHEEARARLREIDSIAPHDGVRSGMCWALAVTHVDEGDLDAALAEFDRNLQYSRNLEAVGSVAGDLFTIGRVQLEAGRIAEAEESFRESLAMSRENAAGDERNLRFVEAREHYLNALLATKRGEYDEALAHVARYETLAEELSPTFMVPQVHEFRGWIALERGDAETALEELFQGDATDVMTMYRIARAYEARGDAASARDWYGYVANYNGSLNLDYSMVRHRAAARRNVL